MLIQAWAVGSAPGNSKETPLSKLWEPRVITLLKNFLVTSACGLLPKSDSRRWLLIYVRSMIPFPAVANLSWGKPTQLLVAQIFTEIQDRLGAPGNK